MRLPPSIDDPQANRPLSGHSHLGRSKAEIVSEDVDLLRRIACRSKDEQDEKRRHDEGIDVSMTGHDGLRWRPFIGSRYNRIHGLRS
jgi:hypothetical protein